MKIINYNKNRLVIGFTLLMLFASCKKLVDVNPPNNKITADDVYGSDITAISVLNGLYGKMSSTLYYSSCLPGISVWAGLSADELSLWSGASYVYKNYYQNSLVADINIGTGQEFWQSTYFYIYAANAAIEGLSKSETLTPAVKQQLSGEAKFLRAFVYFYLVNLYGDIPLPLSTDYSVNAVLKRSPKETVYNQIISDLKDAQNLMADGYVQADAKTLYPLSTAQRIRPSKAAATALLARTYLYTKDFVNAENEATKVIDNSSYYNLVPLNEVFKKNSREAIWQLQEVSTASSSTPDAYTFVLTDGSSGIGSNHPVYLSQTLMNSFEAGDERKDSGNWVSQLTNSSGTYYFAYKYKDVSFNATPSEYTTLLRLAEVYLIRAEARAQQNKLSGAQSDLNAIRNRAGLPNTAASTQADLLTAILHERQVELFTELGHRWLDLKRTSSIDSVMTIETQKKGGSWSSYQQLYPLPVSDLLKDPNLIQNPGY